MISVTGKTVTKRYFNNISRIPRKQCSITKKSSKNALLNKAGRLDSKVIKIDSRFACHQFKRIKPLARERGRLTKRIRQTGPLSSNSAGVSDEEDEEERALVNGPWETMLKQLIGSAFRGGKKKVQIKKENTPVQPFTSGVEKKPPPSMIRIVVSQLSEETSGRRKGRGKRKNEAERLKPMMVGWEERSVSKKLRRNLRHDYDKDPYAQEKKTPHPKAARFWFRHSRIVVDQDGNRITLAWLSVHGALEQVKEKTSTRIFGHQSTGQDCQTT